MHSDIRINIVTVIDRCGVVDNKIKEEIPSKLEKLLQNKNLQVEFLCDVINDKKMSLKSSIVTLKYVFDVTESILQVKKIPEIRFGLIL